MARIHIHWTCQECRHLNMAEYDTESSPLRETWCEDCDLYYFWTDILRGEDYYTLIEAAPKREDLEDDGTL
jgi:hypothetical protein